MPHKHDYKSSGVKFRPSNVPNSILDNLESEKRPDFVWKNWAIEGVKEVEAAWTADMRSCRFPGLLS